MNAKEAKELAIAFKKVKKKIEQACFEGNFSCTFLDLSGQVNDVLTSLGYKVVYTGNQTDYHYIVSWE